jgi:argininosuccinate lyase
MSKIRSQVYVDHILKPTYDFTKKNFFQYIIEINIAHVLMLVKQQILTTNQAKPLLEASTDLLRSGYIKEYNPTFEDLFFMLEDELSHRIGEDLVGNMHIAFSRNDMDATMFRMLWREKIIMWLNQITKLRYTLLNVIKEHEDTVMPAYTHNQQAQPTTLAHYLLGIESHLERDTQRGIELLKRINCSPMGAAALATTGFNIDRVFVQQKLGFDDLVENSYDAIAAADYMLEIASVLSTSLSSISRLVYDLILMTTNEVQALRLDDPLVQTSSIMPQKRNPSSLEHTRALISRSIGELHGIVMMTHSVPFGDIVDIGDDIQPILDQGFIHTFQINDLLTEILRNSTFNKQILYERCKKGFSTVTELADILVRNHGISFRKAHKVISQYVRNLSEQDKDVLDGSAEQLREVVLDVTGSTISLVEREYQDAIDPFHFVNIRNVVGGPSPVETKRQRENAERKLEIINKNIKNWEYNFQNYTNQLLCDVDKEVMRKGRSLS